MKPRLLKFACSACGARLAVPLEMAGMTDCCPKCGAVVTAPQAVTVEAGVPAVTVTGVPEGWSAEQLADALRPELRAGRTQGRAEKPAPQPELFPPAPLAGVGTPNQGHEVLDNILRKSGPEEHAAKGPVTPPGMIPVPPSPGLVHRPAAPAEDVVAAPLPPEATVRSALMPETLSDAREREEAVRPGMGEVLAEQVAAIPVEPDAGIRPVLHVPFLAVGDVGQHAKKMRRQRLTVLGVVCFVVLDVLVALWLFRRPLREWWSGSGEGGQVVEESNAAPAAGSGSVSTRAGDGSGPKTVQGETESTKGSSGAVAAQPPPGRAGTGSGAGGPLPLLSPLPEGVLAGPDKIASSGTMTGVPTLAAPADFPAKVADPASPVSGSQAVPMAIPLPGHAAGGNVPPAMPIQAAEKTESSGAANPGPAPVTPPVVSAKVDTPLVPPPQVTAPPPPPPPAPPSPVGEVAGAVPMVPQAVVAEPAPGPVEKSPPRVSRMPQEAQPAADALMKFLDAATWQDRLGLVQKADKIRPAMEKHAAGFGDGPVVVGKIDFVERYPSKNGVPAYCMFEVSGGSLRHPVMVLVEQSGKTPRVDWEAFVEFKDDLLLRFLENKSSPPQKFRVLLRRKHYFDKDVPNLTEKDGFQLELPNADFEGHVFVSKGSATGRQLAIQLAWGQDIPVIAELTWRADGKTQWVELSGIVSYGWRG